MRAATEKCAHGVPLVREAECDQCEIVWLEEMLPAAERAVARNRKRLDFLRIRVASQQCGDA